MHELLHRKVFDAVFCGDDILAIGALDACIEAGIVVPQEIGILGFNDIAMAAWPSYRLSTIRQPIGDIISTAVDMITEMLQPDAGRISAHVFSCSFVERRTLRPCPA